MNDQNAKADKGKAKLSLVPPQIMYDVAEVREYGTIKYGDPDNWRRVELVRYIDALLRHTMAFVRDNNSVDDESGIEHYKHMACNMAFICELMIELTRGDKHETIRRDHPQRDKTSHRIVALERQMCVRRRKHRGCVVSAPTLRRVCQRVATLGRDARRVDRKTQQGEAERCDGIHRTHRRRRSV